MSDGVAELKILQRHAELMDVLVDLEKAFSGEVKQGYSGRACLIGVLDECEAGGETVTEYELDLADIAILKAALLGSYGGRDA